MSPIFWHMVPRVNPKVRVAVILVWVCCGSANWYVRERRLALRHRIKKRNAGLTGSEPLDMRQSVVRVDDCRLRLGAGSWDFAQDRAREIAEHWTRRRAETPAFFDGRILVMRPPVVVNHVLQAELVETDFKAYLFWRETGFPEAGVFDGFGSALIRSLEGYVLLGRQRGGNLNAGLAYLPGGFIDRRDIQDDGTIAIDASIARELTEETGLDAGEFQRLPGYYVTYCGRQISIAVEYRSALAAEALRLKMLAMIAGQDDPELDDIVTVASGAPVPSHGFAEYVRVLLPDVFSERG